MLTNNLWTEQLQLSWQRHYYDSQQLHSSLENAAKYMRKVDGQLADRLLSLATKMNTAALNFETEYYEVGELELIAKEQELAEALTGLIVIVLESGNLAEAELISKLSAACMSALLAQGHSAAHDRLDARRYYAASTLRTHSDLLAAIGKPEHALRVRIGWLKYVIAHVDDPNISSLYSTSLSDVRDELVLYNALRVATGKIDDIDRQAFDLHNSGILHPEANGQLRKIRTLLFEFIAQLPDAPQVSL